MQESACGCHCWLLRDVESIANLLTDSREELHALLENNGTKGSEELKTRCTELLKETTVSTQKLLQVLFR